MGHSGQWVALLNGSHRLVGKGSLLLLHLESIAKMSTVHCLEYRGNQADQSHLSVRSGQRCSMEVKRSLLLLKPIAKMSIVLNIKEIKPTRVV